MTVDISLFWVMIFIMIIHTVFQHLINWMWREIDKEIVGLGVLVTITEAITLMAILGSVLN